MSEGLKHLTVGGTVPFVVAEPDMDETLHLTPPLPPQLRLQATLSFLVRHGFD